MGIAIKTSQNKCAFATHKAHNSGIDYFGTAKQITIPFGTNFCRCRPCINYLFPHRPYPTVVYFYQNYPSPVPTHPNCVSLSLKPFKAAGFTFLPKQSQRLNTLLRQAKPKCQKSEGLSFQIALRSIVVVN